MDIELLYQDNRIVACVKPAGILSTDEAGGLPELLRARLCDASNTCVRTVHRLDRPVGGVMVLARSRQAARILSEQISARETGKRYLAVTQGTPDAPEGVWTDLLARSRAEHRTYVVTQPGKDVREAALHYRLLDSRAGMSLLEITLFTGRTHQIRAQCSSRALPIVGDRKYGASPQEMEGIALWCRSMEIVHPQSGAPMTFSALPPQVWPWTQFPALYETHAG